MSDCNVTVIICCGNTSTADRHAVPRTTIVTGWLVHATPQQASHHYTGVWLFLRTKPAQLPTENRLQCYCINAAQRSTSSSSCYQLSHSINAIDKDQHKDVKMRFKRPRPFLCAGPPSRGIELLMRVRMGCLCVHERTSQ
jgi:hypothetical protein